ncbi:DNA exonuclease X, partial [mine drainage metagenome]
VVELHELSEKARIPETINFGKHAGSRIADIPSDYKSWYLKLPDGDPMIKQAMRGAKGITAEDADALFKRGAGFPRLR